MTLSGSDTATPTFTAPEVTSNTALTFRLTVSDGDLSATDQVTITVQNVNRAPTANAGPNQTVNEGTEVTLSGSGDDPDGDNADLTYAWTAPSGVTLSSSTVAGPTFTAPDVDADTDYTFTLVVDDGSASSAPDTVVVRVLNGNEPPTANAGSDQTVNEGTEVTLSGSGDDPDGDNADLTYAWTAPSGVTLSSSTVAGPTFTAPDVDADTDYTFTLVVDDGSASSAPDTVVVRVLNGNEPPTANAGSDQTVNEGTEVTLSGSGDDPDGDNADLTYAWTAPSGVTLSSSTVAGPTFTAPDVDADTDYTFTLVVDDGSASSTPDTVVVRVLNGNEPPTANAGPDQTVNEETEVTLSGSGDDPDGDNADLTYAWTAPLGVTLSSSTVASPTFTAPSVDSETDHAFALVVNDGGADSSPDTVVVRVLNVNRPPRSEGTIPAVSVTVGADGSVDVSSKFSDPDGDALTYGATSSDTSVATVSVTGSEVTYTGVAAGSVTVTVTATDPSGSEATQQFTVTVARGNQPPVAVGTISAAELFRDGSGAVEASDYFSDADEDALTYGVSSSDSSVVTVSVTDGVVAYSAAGLGSAEVTVTATDPSGAAAAQAFTVTVFNRAPTPEGTIPARSVAVGADGSVDVSPNFSDADGDALTYGATSSDTSVATVVVSDSLVTYTGVAEGSATVTVTARDPSGSEAEQRFELTVSTNRAPEAVGSMRPWSLTAGGGGARGLKNYFSDADGDSLSYTATSSDTTVVRVRVRGQSLIVTALRRGEVEVTVTASDGRGGAAEQRFTATVANQVPRAVGSMDDRTVEVDGRWTGDVSHYFTDADRDDLSYAAASSDTTVVSAQVTGTVLELSGEARGEAEVTVTASDGHGGEAKQQFTVTVPNRAPAAVGTVEPVTVSAGDKSMVDPSGYFTDPDGDALTYAATSSDTSVATAEVSGGKVGLSGVSRGETEVTVTASDEHGGTAEQMFTVTVPNRAPEAVGTVAPRELGTGENGSVDIAEHFTDPDGDALTYAVSSSDSSVVTVGVTGSEVTYTGASAGEATVTVTASDGHGGTAAQDIAVTVTQTNRAPVFGAATFERSVAENTAAGTAVGAAVTATDPDGDDPSYSLLEADDASSFEVGTSTGQITVSGSADLNYESGRTSLTVRVVASDGTLADTAVVEIAVTDQDDPGVVTLDAGVARVGMRVSATLSDEDGSQSAGKTRQWQLSADGSAGWTDIADATSRFYTPVESDKEMWLRAVFTYTDGHGPNKRAESVAVRVTGPNVAPEFSPSAVEFSVAENSAADTEVGAVTATDGNNDALSYTFVEGGDEASFQVEGTTGRITVSSAAALDYESGTTSLALQVVASDGMLADTAAVTITVTDQDDPGVVTLDAAVARVGMAISATLSDEDGSLNAGKRRQWQRSTDGGATWTDIARATGRSYTPVAGDAGALLRALFTYADGHGPNKRAESAAVRVTGPNVAPEFSPSAVEFSVAENSAAETAVGTPVTATDANGDELEYTFAADGDEASFEIGASTGQITVGDDAQLDYEGGQTSLTVRVVASDGTLADTATVTIAVTDEDDPGVVTLDAAVARVGTAIAATLSDEDVPDAQATTVAWRKSADGGGTWTDIGGATSESYSPVSADEGTLLRAAFAYTDGHGPDKRAESDAVRVTAANAAPAFSPDAVARSVAENSAAGTAVGTPVTATDPNDDALSYTFAAGDDEGSFEIEGSTGQITVASGAALDYESGNTSLEVRVVASDGTLADTASVAIAVTNEDDPGVVTLDAAVARVGTRIAAALTDEDGSKNQGKRRRWQRSDGGGTWTNISGATSRFYTPVAADEGRQLRAVFTYADGHGPNKRAESGAVPVVGATTPVVSFGADTYSVAAGGSVDVVVLLSPTATEELAVEVAVGGSAAARVDTVTFAVDDTEQTLAVGAAGLAAGDTVALSFGTLPSGAVAGAPAAAAVIVGETGMAGADKARPATLTAEYAEPSYAAVAGGAGAEVAVRLSPAADREVVVPVRLTGPDGGAPPEALGVPATLRFAPGDSVRSFNLEAPAGAPGGRYALGFGALPEGVSAGALAASTVDIAGANRDQALFDESLEIGLAVLGRSVAEGARRAIGGRMEAAMRGGAGGGARGGGLGGGWANRAAGLLGSLAGPRPDARAAAGPHTRPAMGDALERLLPQLSFSAGVGRSQEGAAPRFSVWGEGSAQGFRGEPGGLSYDGGMRALSVGADARVAAGARVGVSVMRSGGEFDYTNRMLEGTLEHGMTTVHPYLFFQPSAGLGLWAMAGYGTGQVEAAGQARSLDATLNMVSGGARVPLVRRGAFGLGLAGDVFGVRMSAGDDGADGAATRGRALIEASYAARGLRLAAEAGGRYDGGDADTGAGAETGASVAYAGGALDAALNGRVAFGSGGHREWGVALRLAWDPGVRGRGFRFAVTPASGQDRSGMQGLLEGGYATRGHHGGQAQRFDAEAGYGFAVLGAASLDAFGRLSAREDARSWTLGAGYDLASALRFSLEAVRAQSLGAPARQGIRAGLNFRF